MNVRIIILFLFPMFALAQTPQKINFQSIMRNSSGEVVGNRVVNMRISILSGSSSGSDVFSETHVKTTDAMGLISIEMGTGTVLSGVFSSIDWGNTAHFIKLEADFTGGTTYELLGTQELMSVPYALYAGKSDTSVLNLTSRLATKLNVTDTAFLSNRIDAKLNKSDTSLLHLTSRLATKLNVSDTGFLSNRIDLKLSKTDTSLLNLTSRLATKLNVTDTSFLSDRIDAKLTKTDTASLSDRIDLKLTKTDTVSLSNRIDAKLTKTDTVSLSNRIDAKLTKTDTVSLSDRIDAKLTKTDTASLSNRIDVKLSKTDTASLSDRIDFKLTKTDTTTMLSTYLRKTDAIITDLQNQVALLSSYTSLLASGLVDIDGNNYPVVKIGNQIWMKENLRTRKYNDGTDIRFDNSGGSVGTSPTWAGAGRNYGAYTIYANDSTATPSNLTSYGYLYNWYAVAGIITDGGTPATKNICPSGWHVPTDAEWTIMIQQLDNTASATTVGVQSTTAGTLMKKNDVLWTTNTGTNTSGFSALPGGYRNNDGSFLVIRYGAFFWSATEHDYIYAWIRGLNFYSGEVYRLSNFDYNKSVGASVRCLRD